MNVVAITAAVIGVVAVFGAVFLHHYLLQVQRKKQRSGSGVRQFVAYFEEESSISSELLETVYRYLQRCLSVRDFPVDAGDDLNDVYGIGAWGGLSLREVIDDLVEQLKLESPSDHEIQTLMQELNWSNRVLDLVHLLAQLKALKHA